MSSQPTRIAVMVPGGETPESWAKFKIECLAIAWRADARAYTWRWMARIGLIGWVLFIPLAAQVFAPGIVMWVIEHVTANSMKAVAVVTVGAVLIYAVVEEFRERGFRYKRKAVSA